MMIDGIEGNDDNDACQGVSMDDVLKRSALGKIRRLLSSHHHLLTRFYHDDNFCQILWWKIGKLKESTYQKEFQNKKNKALPYQTFLK